VSYFANPAPKIVRRYSERTAKQPSPEIGEKFYFLIEMHDVLQNLNPQTLCSNLLTFKHIQVISASFHHKIFLQNSFTGI